MYTHNIHNFIVRAYIIVNIKFMLLADYIRINVVKHEDLTSYLQT